MKRIFAFAAGAIVDLLGVAGFIRSRFDNIGAQRTQRFAARFAPHRRSAAAAMAVLALSACTSVPPDLGRSDVDALVAERGVPGAEAIPNGNAQPLSELLAAPLAADSAVRVALVNNPRLKAAYADLGFAAADVYEAGRIRNPVFSSAWLRPDVGGEQSQLTLSLITSFTDFITLPARKRLAEAEFAAVKQSIGAEVLNVATTTEAAYYDYIGARQVVALRRQIAKAGVLSAALAKRYHDAGNISARELALENASASEANLQALHAEAAAFASRTTLATLLGVSVGDTWDAPPGLPMPLAAEDALDVLITRARESRLDLAAARTRAELLADRYGVVNWTRWLGELDVGGERERETDGSHISGALIDWEVPIFTQHNDALLRAEAEMRVAIADVQRIATDVDNGVQLAHAAVQNARARADEYRIVLIPERAAAAARAQEEVNFMLIGIFELIGIKQQEYDAYQGYLEAIRDYWLARVELTRATGNSLPSSASIGEQRIDAQQLLQPASGGTDHSGHGAMQGMQSKGSSEMPGMQMAPAPQAMPGMQAAPAPTTQPNSTAPAHNGMDHSQHAMPPAAAPNPHEQHNKLGDQP